MASKSKHTRPAPAAAPHAPPPMEVPAAPAQVSEKVEEAADHPPAEPGPDPIPQEPVVMAPVEISPPAPSDTSKEVSAPVVPELPIPAPQLSDEKVAELRAGPPIVLPTPLEVAEAIQAGYSPEAVAKEIAEQKALQAIQQRIPRYRVRAISERGFWRIKRHFTQVAVEIPVSLLTEDEIKKLTDTCDQLEVTLLDG